MNIRWPKRRSHGRPDWRFHEFFFFRTTALCLHLPERLALLHMTYSCRLIFAVWVKHSFNGRSCWVRCRSIHSAFLLIMTCVQSGRRSSTSQVSSVQGRRALSLILLHSMCLYGKKMVPAVEIMTYEIVCRSLVSLLLLLPQL